MSPHTRALIAAAAHAFISGKAVVGVHDHAAKRDLRIAAETRGNRLQGFDGDRSSQFSGLLPELHDLGDNALISLEIEAMTARGYDRLSQSHYSLTVTDQVVQLYDHKVADWFAFSIQSA